MMTITEKVAYLRGLAQGLGIDDSDKYGKIINALVDALDDIAFTVVDLEDGFAQLSEVIDEIDEDLGSVEKDFYDIDDEDEDDEEDDFDDFDDDLYEVTCPSCGDVVCVLSEMLDEGQMNCPNCGELLEFDFEDDDECCCGDCGCGKDKE